MGEEKKAQLVKMLKQLAKAANDYREAIEAIDEYCEEVYGITPGAVDNDSFLDRNAGLCGMAAPMTAEEFDDSMKSAMSANNTGKRIRHR